jgi:hypothetical protein
MQAAAQNSLPSTGSAAWPSANLAFYWPFVLSSGVTVYQLAWMVGGTQNGNIDIGIYTKEGARILSIGSTAMGAINVLQVIDIADTPLGPGEYHLAGACDSATGTVQRVAPGFATARMTGILQQASAFPLPATATFAAAANAIMAGIAAFLHPSV